MRQFGHRMCIKASHEVLARDGSARRVQRCSGVSRADVLVDRRTKVGEARDRAVPNEMLIDATHPERTRVVVVRGHHVEECDFESANRDQLRGNIYLAKVTRVEPSLQAAFVDYGGNRHGFLAFSEIHPDYYRIPVSDRSGRDGELHEAPERAGLNGGEEPGVPLAAALPEPVPVPETAEDEAVAEEETA